MIDEDNIIGNKEVAEILGYKDNALSMVKLRSKDFPKPIKILSATPLYRKTDIKEWAKKHGREKLKLIESTDNYIMITLGGERGAGKSFLTSLFVRRSIEYRKASCGMGDHCTQCVVKNSIRANLEDSEEMVILRVLPEKVKNIERRKELEEKASEMDGTQYKLSRISTFYKEIEPFFKELEELGFEVRSVCEIDIVTEASEMTKEIMKELDIKEVIIYDTPGLVKDKTLDNTFINKCDLLLLILQNTDKESAKLNFRTMLEGITPSIACSKVNFLYRAEESSDDEEEWKEVQESAVQGMNSLKDIFDDLRGDGVIITSSMDILNPNDNILGIPVMKSKKLTVSEELFIEALKNKIIKSLKTKTFEELDKNIREQKVNNNEVNEIEIIEEILSEIKKENVGNNYFEQFYNEHHNRVKSRDNYRILNCVEAARDFVLNDINKIFKRFNVKDYPQKYIQEIIKYMYALITSTIKQDIGISIGGTPNEDVPPVTMYAIESILAKEIINVKKLNYESYCETLRDKGNIYSKSWGFVSLKSDKKQGLEKLKLINECKLRELKSKNLYELVRNCYIYGMEELGEYKIIRTIFELNNVDNAENVAFEKVKEIFKKQITNNKIVN